jgi:glucose-6-phosphate-specific signal transduction histidine kinase
MNTKTQKSAILALNYSLMLITGLAATLPAIREGRFETLKTGAFCALIVVTGLSSVRILNRQLKSEEDTRGEINNKYLHSLKIISELDTQTRREISLWLHGDVQRQLMNLARNLRNQGASDMASEVSKLNDETIRSMAHRLHPPQLDISLELALSDLCHGQADLQLSDNLHLQNMTNSTFVVLQSELRIAIYRIVEEGISNALKKPSTRKISVHVSAGNAAIDISVQDDGDRLTDGWKESLGFSLIEIFVEQFDGNWSISNNKDGVILQATLRRELTLSRDYKSKNYPNFSKELSGDTK